MSGHSGPHRRAYKVLKGGKYKVLLSHLGVTVLKEAVSCLLAGLQLVLLLR